ncbi:hypothetical protein KUCAC02_000364, partial [Chaenocephalus aceratus]
MTGSAISKAVCKATTHEVSGPKKKHLDSSSEPVPRLYSSVSDGSLWVTLTDLFFVHVPPVAVSFDNLLFVITTTGRITLSGPPPDSNPPLTVHEPPI